MGMSSVGYLSIDCLSLVINGAQERTRTSTSIRTLAPEASASTNSATWAGVVRWASKRAVKQSQRYGGAKYKLRSGSLLISAGVRKEVGSQHAVC